MEKINKVCGVCGSDEITLNAAVKWDVTDQRYRLSMDGGEYECAVLYCSTSDWSFGPIFENADEAESFL